MAKHQWSVLCRRSIIDKDDNTLSLIDLLEQVGVVYRLPEEAKDKTLEIISSGQGTSPIGILLVSLWIRENREESEISKGRIIIKDPNGDEISNSGFDIDLSTAIRTRHKMQYPGIPFNGSFGTYQFITQQKKEGKTRWATVSKNLLDILEK